LIAAGRSSTHATPDESVPSSPDELTRYESSMYVRLPGVGVRVLLGYKICTSSVVHTGVVVRSASCPMSTEALSLRLKRPEREADHSPLSSAEVKTRGIRKI
jgi:hypothetical protein